MDSSLSPSDVDPETGADRAALRQPRKLLKSPVIGQLIHAYFVLVAVLCFFNDLPTCSRILCTARHAYFVLHPIIDRYLIPIAVPLDLWTSPLKRAAPLLPTVPGNQLPYPLWKIGEADKERGRLHSIPQMCLSFYLIL